VLSRGAQPMIVIGVASPLFGIISIGVLEGIDIIILFGILLFGILLPSFCFVCCYFEHPEPS
jgi:hypothetical protein